MGGTVGSHRQRTESGGPRPAVFLRVTNAALWIAATVMIVPLVIGVFGGAFARVPEASAAAGAGHDPVVVPVFPLLLNTLLVAGAVGGVATGIGTMVAWRLPRRVPAFVIAFGALPLVMPPYLAYAGWGVLRSPGWALGDWIGSRPGASAGALSHATGVVMAVLGLALWAWPLAALIVGASIRRLDADLLTMLDHEARGLGARVRLRLRLVAPAIAMAALVIGLLVCGSAIPLHLANVPTLAINVWLLLDRSPPELAWRAHGAAWPLYVGAALAGWWLGGRAASWGLGERVNAPERRESSRAAGVVVVIAAVGVSFVAPAVLLIASLRDPRSIGRFWTISADAVAHGALIASITGVLVVLVALAVAISLGARGPGRARGGPAVWFARVAIVLGLVPGVLVGSGLVSGWNRIDPTGVITSSIVIEVLAHLGRFAWIGAIGGCLLVRLEHPSLRDLRRAEGGGTIGAYARTRLVLDAPILGAIGLGAAFLSVTEIEASVVVSIPGPGNLARQILNNLHFARNEELSAAALWIVGSGLGVVCLVAAMALIRAGLERTTPVSP